MGKERNKQDDETSLIDLIAVLWPRRVMIITITSIAMVGAVILSIISLVLPTEISPLPNKYTPTALMLIDNSSSSNSLSSMLNNMSGMSGLASLAGIGMAEGSSSSELALFLVGTNTFLDVIVTEFDLIERYEIKKFPRTSSRKKLKKLLKATFDEKSSVMSISFTDIDPVFARDVVNFSTMYLEKRFEDLGIDKNKIEKENLEANINNTFEEIIKLENDGHRLEQTVVYNSAAGRLPSITMEINRIALELEVQRQVYSQLKVQYELLKVTMASESPVFQILEMAEVPDMKSKPSRGLICVIITFAAGLFAALLAFSQNAIANIKKDPVAMAKLRGENT